MLCCGEEEGGSTRHNMLSIERAQVGEINTTNSIVTAEYNDKQSGISAANTPSVSNY